VKPTASESAVLDVNDILESIRQQQKQRSAVTGQGFAQIAKSNPIPYGFVVEQVPAGPRLRLHYTLASDSQREAVETVIPLKTNQPGFGGTRWWLSCPDCQQRRARLYLAPNTMHFACKKCHNMA